jgi:putative ABC transport system permease protein
VLARVRALPGVVAAGATGDLPFEGGFSCTVQQFEDPTVKPRILDAGETTCAGPEATTPGYFEAVGIPVLAGRTFTAGDIDDPASGAVIVSKAFAERFWPGRDPIGQGVASGGRLRPFSHVVGVVGDVYASAVDQPPALAIYYPVGVDDAAPHLVVRVARGDPLSYLPAIRRATWEVDPTVPLANAEAMETVVARSMSRRVVSMALLGVAGGLALLLAAIGVYALIAYVVARRTNEIGIRLALGAQPREVERMVVREAGRLAAAGVVLGVAGAVGFARLLGSLLFGVRAWDPAAYAVATLVLASVATVAAWVPARRAARVDPALALRSE